MIHVNRRSFLAAVMAAAHARTLKIVGVQLYTVRSALPEKPLETLQAIDRIGYREAEVTAAGMDKIWPALKQTSLKPVSLHMDSALFMKQQDKLPAALDDAKQRGFEYVVCPYIAPADRGGADVIRKLGETLNKAGEICLKSGLKLAYHNHAFEFQPQANGGNLLDVLMQTADPKLVNLELDIMWSTVGDVDPVSILKKYGNRVAMMHLKNVAPGIKQYNENVPKTAFREVGNGVIDIPAVLRAATEAGVKHYFVEQDQTPGDPLVSLRQSFQYLEKLNF